MDVHVKFGDYWSNGSGDIRGADFVSPMANLMVGFLLTFVNDKSEFALYPLDLQIVFEMRKLRNWHISVSFCSTCTCCYTTLVRV